MTGVGSALRDPLLQRLLLGRREGFLGLGRGHDGFWIGGENPCDQLAGFGFAGVNGAVAVEVGFGLGFEVEAEFGFARILIGAVAAEAVFGEDGADVPIEVEGGGVERSCGRSEGEQCGEGDAADDVGWGAAEHDACGARSLRRRRWGRLPWRWGRGGVGGEPEGVLPGVPGAVGGARQ